GASRLLCARRRAWLPARVPSTTLFGSPPAFDGCGDGGGTTRPGDRHPMGRSALRHRRGVRCHPGGDRRRARLPPLRLLGGWIGLDRKSTRLNSSHVKISYAVFCLKKKT